MDYQLSGIRQKRPLSSVNLTRELDLLKWKKKSEAKQQLRRTRAAHKASSSGIPKIDNASRLLAVAQTDEQDRLSMSIFRISDTLRATTDRSQTTKMDFKVSLSNCTISRKTNFSLGDESSIIKPTRAETSTGITYESILQTFTNRAKSKSLTDREYQPLVPPNKCVVYSSGFNSEAFVKRAKPLIKYQTISIN